MSVKALPGTKMTSDEPPEYRGSDKHKFLNTCMNGVIERSVGIYVKRLTWMEVHIHHCFPSKGLEGLVTKP